MVPHDLDNVDRRLVEALAADGRATVTSLAQQVGLSGPSVHERLRKLEAAGAIRGYAALVDPDAVGAGVAAFVAMNLGPGLADKQRIDLALAREPHVLEVHEVAGEDCYLVKLRVGSPQELSEAVASLRKLSPTVTTRTTMVLRTILERPLLSTGSDG
jgi:Lrp/AsnC family leucine-responsive transcriptional regulator